MAVSVISGTSDKPAASQALAKAKADNLDFTLRNFYDTADKMYSNKLRRSRERLGQTIRGQRTALDPHCDAEVTMPRAIDS